MPKKTNDTSETLNEWLSILPKIDSKFQGPLLDKSLSTVFDSQAAQTEAHASALESLIEIANEHLKDAGRSERLASQTWHLNEAEKQTLLSRVKSKIKI